MLLTYLISGHLPYCSEAIIIITVTFIYQTSSKSKDLRRNRLHLLRETY